MSIQAQAAALDVACGDELTVDGCVARASPAHPSPRLCAQPTHVRDPVLTAQSRSASCDSLTAPTRPLTLNVTDALLPELCELRWCVAPCAPRPAQLVPHASACVSAFGLLCVLLRNVCGSREVCGLCSFGSAGILTLATTCKTYAVGLKHEVRRATAIVVWRPSFSDVCCGCIIRYVAKSDSMHAWHLLLGVDDDDMPELIFSDAPVVLSVSEHQSRGAVHTHVIVWPM